ILKDFNKALDKDIDSLRSTLNKIVEAQNKKLLMESQQQLQETILQEFSGNIFGQILSDALLPMAFNGFSGRGGFRQSGSQSLFDIGKAISRAQTRNG
ncbi:MAG: hypothetical protein K0R98_1298, partial [Rickettsiaceae bacterium]|nr:hypothetical protein [Rickettsiaceae bacterium]